MQPAAESPAILIVDEDQVSRSVVIALLSRRLPGLRFVEAGSAPGAFSAARDTAPALVVMDGRLAGVAAGALVHNLRRARPGVPVVVLTAGRRAALPGLDALEDVQVMHKPVRPETADRIAAMLSVAA